MSSHQPLRWILSTLARRGPRIGGAFLLCSTLVLIAWSLTPADGGLLAPFAPLSARAAAQTCRTDLKTQLRELDVPGIAAAIVKKGGIVCTAVAGMANIEQSRPVTPETLFLVASVSKTITAAALLQLHDAGKFRLDDDINRHLPFRVRIPAAPASAITFRHLLTHTASINDNVESINCPGACPYGATLRPIVTRGADSPISLADFVRGYFTPGGAYYSARANFYRAAPGTMIEYSNMGISLAGYLTEVISGTAFDQYGRDNIFAPLGMRKTSWRLAEIDQTMLAMPYDKLGSRYLPYGQYGEPDYPDGMLRSSVVELARFLIAHMQDGQYGGARVLNSATVSEIFKNQMTRDSGQGLVWFNRSDGERLVWGHDGADNGAGAEMWFDPARQQGVILLTNGVWKNESALLSRLLREADQY